MGFSKNWNANVSIANFSVPDQVLFKVLQDLLEFGNVETKNSNRSCNIR